MGRIEVTPASLRSAGGSVRGAGLAIGGLAGQVRSAAGAHGAPPDTAAALEAFSSTWSSGLAQLGDAVGAVGLAVDAAAGLYELTDATAMPEAGR